ncbi:MAG: hypothetical protein Q9226_007057 [Calogaya cf. arnoldii]
MVETRITEPYDYLAAQPDKDIHKQLVGACNFWFKIDEASLATIGKSVSMLHNAVLLSVENLIYASIDDLQNNSNLRHGRPSAHIVYGMAQTIYSANHAKLRAQKNLSILTQGPVLTSIFNEELQNLYRGQGMDVCWRETPTNPTEGDYLHMASYKAGGLFRLEIRLMQAVSESSVDLNILPDLIGMITQLQDDYLNLTSQPMTSAERYCSDLEAGRFSFPIIHAIRNDPSVSKWMLRTLRSKPKDDHTKRQAVNVMTLITGSMEYTSEKLRELLRQMHHLLFGFGPRNTAFDEVWAQMTAYDIVALPEPVPCPVSVDGESNPQMRGMSIYANSDKRLFRTEDNQEPSYTYQLASVDTLLPYLVIRRLQSRNSLRIHSVPRKAMRLGWLPLLSSFCLITLSTSTPLPADEPGNNNLGLPYDSNALSIAQPRLSVRLPPPRFAITAASGTKPIRDRDIFELSIKVLSQVALTPFGISYRAHVYTVPNAPNIGLGVGGPGARHFTNYTVWGLTLATKYMVDNNSFRNWRFKLYYGTVFVGQIWYVNGNPILNVNDTNTTNDPALPPQTQITQLQDPQIPTLGAVPAIQFWPSGPGPQPTLNEVMMTIISGLSEIAPYDKDQKIANNYFSTNFAPYRGTLEINFSWPPLLAPAWYTFKFMIALLGFMAQKYINFLGQPGPPRLRVLVKQSAGGLEVGRGVLRI